MFERFTDRSRKVLALANQEASRLNHDHLGTEHILLGLFKEGSGVGWSVLKRLGLPNLSQIRIAVEELVKVGPEIVTMGRIPQTPRAKKVIEFAIEEARNLNHNYVGTEHLLLGLVRVEDGIASAILKKFNISIENIREDILDLLGESERAEESGSGTDGISLTWLSNQKDLAVQNADYVMAIEIRKAIDLIEVLRKTPIVLQCQNKTMTWDTKVATPEIQSTRRYNLEVRIPPSEYILAYDKFPVITWDMILKVHSQEDIEHFRQWMDGQTVMGMPDGSSGIYTSDYERWLRQGKKTGQNAEDWD
jgi:hypothetical protein